MIGVVLWIEAACAPPMPHRIDAVRNYNATFLCDGTKVMTVRFTPFAAVLEGDGIATELTQQPSTDGFFYKGGGQSLQAREHEAVWTDSHGTHHCQERIAANCKDSASRRRTGPRIPGG